jgi:hypothetical protein
MERKMKDCVLYGNGNEGEGDESSTVVVAGSRVFQISVRSKTIPLLCYCSFSTQSLGCLCGCRSISACPRLGLSTRTDRFFFKSPTENLSSQFPAQHPLFCPFLEKGAINPNPNPFGYCP